MSDKRTPLHRNTASLVRLVRTFVSSLSNLFALSLTGLLILLFSLLLAHEIIRGHALSQSTTLIASILSALVSGFLWILSCCQK